MNRHIVGVACVATLAIATAANEAHSQMLTVSPAANIASSDIQGQASSPTSFSYQLSATGADVTYSITNIPSWLNASFTSGTILTGTSVVVTFTVANQFNLTPPGPAASTIDFTNTTVGGTGSTTRTATLTIAAGTQANCASGGWKNFMTFPGPFTNETDCRRAFP